jgi:hypothetical protein
VGEAAVLIAGLVLAPVLFFLRDQGYTPLLPQIALIVIVGMAAWLIARGTVRLPRARAAVVAAAVTLFADLAFELDPPIPGIGETKVLLAIAITAFLMARRLPAATIRIGAAMVATLTAVTVVSPSSPVVFEEGTAEPPRSSEPLFIHIVLDEHMGIEGLLERSETAQTGSYVREWFEGRGFRVAGGVYAQDFASEYSLGRVFNVRADLAAGDAVDRATGPFETTLTRNAHLRALHERGYTLRVLQTSFVNLCPPSIPASCLTYDAWKLGTPAFARLPMRLQLDIAGSLLLRRVALWEDVSRMAGEPLPELALVSPLSGLSMLDDLRSMLREAAPGEAYLAHIPAPHYPYVHGADCRVRPMRDWLDMHDPAAPPGVVNTPEGQSLRYVRYAEQIRCVLEEVGRILDAIPAHMVEDATVLIHGDHGSRIIQRRLADPSTADMRDYVDAYSTLFALRAPGVAAGYQDDQISLGCLFRVLDAADFSAVPEDFPRCLPDEDVFIARSHLPLSIGAMPPIRTRD